jgi:23S rRNA pseudouridine2604 synthase
MATLRIKKPGTASPHAPRAPVRGAGAGVKRRPTLAEAQAERAERETRFQAQRQQQGAPSRTPAARPDERRVPGPDRPPLPAARPTPPRPAGGPANNAFQARPPRPGPPTAASPHAPTAAHPPARASAPAPASDHAPGTLRLSKRMSELGIASRREADEWIARGLVRVDGRIVAELGARVLPDQHITVDAKARHEQAQRVTVLLNKPIGYVSGQAEDGYEPAVVLVTARSQWREDRSGTQFLPAHLKHLAPAGRLDIDSVGLLVLTQDGRVAKQLIGEDRQVEKEYLVRVDAGNPADGTCLSAADLALLNHGLELDGEPLAPARVEWVNDDQLRFVLTEGKKRQIRRMCEAVGLKVTGLKRVRIGRVMLGDLPAGQWRYLRADEAFV